MPTDSRSRRINILKKKYDIMSKYITIDESSERYLTRQRERILEKIAFLQRQIISELYQEYSLKQKI